MPASLPVSSLVAQPLQLEVQFLLLFRDPGVRAAWDTKPQIACLFARREGGAQHELGLQGTEGPAALDPDVARPQALAQHGKGGDLPETPVPLAIGRDEFAHLLGEMAERHLGRQSAAIIPIELSQEIDRCQQRILCPGRQEGEGIEQRGGIAADPGIALGGAEQWIGLGGRGQGFDVHAGQDQAIPADLAVKHLEGVLASLVGFGEHAQRVAEHAQKPARLFSSVEMPLVLPGLGLGKQAGDQPAEHGDRGIGQLAGQFDHLRRDQRVPASRVEVVSQPAWRHGALAHQLCPTIRIDACAALRIKAERPDEDQPFDQGEQILLARRLRQGPQPSEAGLSDGGIDPEQLLESFKPLRRQPFQKACLHSLAGNDTPCRSDALKLVG